MQTSLIVVGKENVPGLGEMEKTIPFEQATDKQKKYSPRILVNKRGQIIKRISTADLMALDREYERKYGKPVALIRRDKG